MSLQYGINIIISDQALSKSGNAISDVEGKASKPSKWGKNQVFATTEAETTRGWWIWPSCCSFTYMCKWIGKSKLNTLQFYLSLKIAKLNTREIRLTIFLEIWCNLVIDPLN